MALDGKPLASGEDAWMSLHKVKQLIELPELPQPGERRGSFLAHSTRSATENATAWSEAGHQRGGSGVWRQTHVTLPLRPTPSRN
ncbi:hypothetical protein [Escherichia coli]|uniref:hypothetical protein n=1 Tax=Escherichia coli TaxID=562 RepID=UPI003890EB1C